MILTINFKFKMDVEVINPSKCLVTKRNILNGPEKDSKNAFLSVVPPNLKFTFSAENLKTQEKTVEITNYFPKSCPIQLLPLDTQYFRIRNAFQRQWLSPGSVFKINILFIPDEARDYSSVLKVHYFDDRILEIKMTAKIMRTTFFPTNINFGNVPLGQAACYKIPIYSYAEKKVSFAILPSKEDPCVDIYPRCGHVRPHQKPVIVMIIYRPLRYVSMNFQFRIFLSDLCKTPHVINFYAYTRPGLLRETLENVERGAKNKIRLAKVNPISRQKIKPISLEKSVPKFLTKLSTTTHRSSKEALVKQCSYLPVYTLHAVNCILNSKIRKPYSEHELKGPLNAYMSHTIEQKIQQLKEFLIKVENYRQQNEQAKNHHRPKVNYGIRDISENQIIEIMIQREREWHNYKDSMHTSVKEVLFERKEAEKIKQRILRAAQKYPSVISASFRNGQSCLRYCKIVPFIQAARKIVLRNRLLKILEKLRRLTPELIIEFEEPLRKT